MPCLSPPLPSCSVPAKVTFGNHQPQPSCSNPGIELEVRNGEKQNSGSGAQRMGVKKRDTKNHHAAVSAVSPVRPPSRIPAALSMNAATCMRSMLHHAAALTSPPSRPLGV